MSPKPQIVLDAALHHQVKIRAAVLNERMTVFVERAVRAELKRTERLVPTMPPALR
jgi:hypothetical protein